MTLHLIFLVLAFLLFVLAGVGMSYKSLNFGWLGLAFLTLAEWLHA